MGLPAANVPAVKVPLSTSDDMKKVAAALLGEVNASSDAAVSAIPVPVSEMMILPLEGTMDARVMATVIVTLELAMPVRLRVILNRFAPMLQSIMSLNVPVPDAKMVMAVGPPTVNSVLASA